MLFAEDGNGNDKNQAPSKWAKTDENRTKHQKFLALAS
jgi:hypothetical protein